MVVSISVYGISNTSFQRIRTSLCATGFSFPLPSLSPSSVVAEVQTRSVTDGITWTGKAQAGFQHTRSLVCHPSTPAPHRWDRASPLMAVLQLPPLAPPRLWLLRVKRKQNKEETPSSDKRAPHNEQILFQSRWEKIRGAPLSVSSAWRDGEWKQPLKQPNEAGGQACGNTSSTACTLLLAVTLLGRALEYLKLDGVNLTAALAVRGSEQGRDKLSGERCSSPHVSSPGCTSDFKVISCPELGLPGLTRLRLRSRRPISIPCAFGFLLEVKQVILTEISKPASKQRTGRLHSSICWNFLFLSMS